MPRLRHQVARLLIDNGHDVTFFEKPLYFYEKKKNKSFAPSENIKILRTKQLLHHQLRVFDSLQYLNAEFEKYQIKKEINYNYISNFSVINFNYDYYFLRDLFPFNKITTIINDDFVAQARFFKGKHVLNCLERTCRISDHVFVVSIPLRDQLKKWCEPIMFYPWASNAYIKPSVKFKRNSILIWAHIDRRFDLDIIAALVMRRPDFFVDIIGPISDNLSERVKKLKNKFVNIRLRRPEKIDDINTDSYFCSLIPYKANVADIEAVTVSNKTFQLLSKGLPIVTHGMPNFYRHSAIFNCSNFDLVLSAIDSCHHHFDDLQPSINELVDTNQAKDRYSTLIRCA